MAGRIRPVTAADNSLKEGVKTRAIAECRRLFTAAKIDELRRTDFCTLLHCSTVLLSATFKFLTHPVTDCRRLFIYICIFLFPCGRLSWHDVSLLARFNDLATKTVGVEARGDGGVNKLPRVGPVVELYIRADLWLSDEAAAAAARRYWHAGVKPSVNERNVDAFSYQRR